MSIWINLIILYFIIWSFSSKAFIFYCCIVSKTYWLLTWFSFIFRFFYFLLFQVSIFVFTNIFWISITIVSVILIRIHFFLALFCWGCFLRFLFCLEQILYSLWICNISTSNSSSMWTLDSMLIISICTLIYWFRAKLKIYLCTLHGTLRSLPHYRRVIHIARPKSI